MDCEIVRPNFIVSAIILFKKISSEQLQLKKRKLEKNLEQFRYLLVKYTSSVYIRHCLQNF